MSVKPSIARLRHVVVASSGFSALVLTTLLLPADRAGAGELAFRSDISQGMVLQRGQPVSLSGTATPTASVTIRLAGQTRSVGADASGDWSVDLPAMAHGGPYILTVSENGAAVTIDDVWVGDVWVCAGQSNMQMGLAEIIGGEKTMADLSRQPGIRFLEMPRGGADSPQGEFKAEWKRGSPDSLAGFSAVAGTFAEHLRRDPLLADIPLGLINSSFGGTSIEAWSPAASLSDLPKDQLSGSMFGIPPGALFNRMMHPLFARPIKGVVWYQGEANAGQPALYVRLLRNLMDQWRKGWRQADLPFLVVQLPAFEGTMGSLDFGWLREAQDKACLGFPHAWCAVTYDTTDGFDLHPKEKQEIGRRLALIARREVYGLPVKAHGPRLENVQPRDGRLIVNFDQPVGAPQGAQALGFAIAGEDGDSRFAMARIEGNTVILEAEGVPQPKTVRYAWGGLTNANLAGPEGLPAFPFRTDALPPESVAFQPMPAFHRIDTPVYQLETGSAGRLASLIVRGQQFLSNDPGGGVRVPGGFGYRNLSRTTVTGPRRLALSDGGVTLEVACFPSEMTWTLTNHGSDPVDLHITLDKGVTLQAQGQDVTLSRGEVRVHLSGIERVEDHKIIAKAPPHASARLQFSFAKP